MNWVLRQTLILLGTSMVMCLIPIGIGRVTPAPDRWQALRLGQCNDDPCYQGIKLGTAIEQPTRGLPEIFQDGPITVTFIPTGDGKLVSIVMEPASDRF